MLPQRARSFLFVLIASLLLALFAHAEEPSDPFSFVVMGDAGCGCVGQRRVADKLISWHKQKPFNVVLMTGDNIYGDDFYQRFYFFRRRGGDPIFFEARFDRFYEPLLKQGVKFYAVLGNHDYETQQGRFEIEDKDRFNMKGDKGYYTISPNTREDDLITIYALNSVRLLTRPDPDQLEWLQKELASDDSRWKVAFYHHPIYTAPGKHGPAETFLKFIEPVFVKHGVKVTFAGHNHFYSRMKPQKGITHFTTGGGGRGLKTPRPSSITAKIARAYHFVYVEVYPQRLDYWVVPPTGPFLDTGSISPDTGIPPTGANK